MFSQGSGSLCVVSSTEAGVTHAEAELRLRLKPTSCKVLRLQSIWGKVAASRRQIAAAATAAAEVFTCWGLAVCVCVCLFYPQCEDI